MADELARCLVDARHAADAVEELLTTLQRRDDTVPLHRAVEALAAPAAVARILDGMIDQPQGLVLACVRLLRETAARGVDGLDRIDGVESANVVAALETTVVSCERLLDAAI